MEKKIRAYLIDDEEAPRKLMRYLVKRHLPEIEIVGESNRLDTGVEEISSKPIDVLFLDIEMPEHNGTEILNFINPPVNFEIIFVTAYNEYAVKAFKLSAFDYLLKPLQVDELIATINRLKERMISSSGHKEEQIELLNNNLSGANERTYCLRTHKEEYIIPIDEIIYLEADGMYTNITLKTDKITASKPLKEIIEDLSDSFFRTHRSFAVNMKNVSNPVKIKTNMLHLANDVLVPLSSRMKNQFIESYNEYIESNVVD